MKLEELKKIVYTEVKKKDHPIGHYYDDKAIENVLKDIENAKYEYVGFREPLNNEVFISILDGSYITFGGAILNEPRIIVKKIPRKRYIFTETGEFRNLNPGEYGINEEGELFVWGGMRHTSLGKYKVLKQTEEMQ